MVLAAESLKAALEKVQAGINRQLDRQYERLVVSLHGLLDDLFNYPLERPWPMTLAQFATHWEARGLRLTDATLSSLGRLIADRIGDDATELLAEGPLSHEQLFSPHADASSPLTPFAEKPKTDSAAPDGIIPAAAIFEAARMQKLFGLSEEERMRLEFFYKEQLLRRREGRPLLPEPLFLHEARQRHQQGPAIQAVTPELQAENIRRKQLEEYWNLPPEERRKLALEWEREARNKLAAEYGGTVAFLNPGLPGGLSDLLAALSGLSGASGLGGRTAPRALYRPLPSDGARNRRGPRGKSPPPSLPPKQPTKGKRRPQQAGKRDPASKPPLPPPVDRQRYPIRPDGTSAINLRLAAESEEMMAYYLHSLSDHVVLFWGQKQGMQGADIITFNLRTKRVTLWDVKYRTAAVRLRPSRTFQKGTPARNNAIQQAYDAVQSSRLSNEDKVHASQSLDKRTFQTITVGAGNAKNSAIGD